MVKKKILLSDSLSKEGKDVLKAAGFIVDEKTNLSVDELKNQIKNYHGIIIRSGTKLTADIIKHADKMQVIGRAGVGLDNIDLDAASKKGIIVMNAPGGNTISTAEHTMSLLLSLSRNIPQSNVSVKQGKWERKKFMGVQLYGKTIGIIGLGRIGSEVAKRCIAFGMNVNAYDPFLSEEKAEQLGVRLTNFDTLIKESDYITFHVPLTAETKHLIGAKEIKKMKNNVKIINCARGGIIDEVALEEGIRKGKISGVALDVFEKKPSEGNKLLKYDNVIGTCHLGASTQEAQKEVAVEIAKQLVDALKGKALRNTVNVPSLDPESYKVLKPYIDLSEKIASFQGQLIRGRIKKISIGYGGEAADQMTTPMTIAILKGILAPVVGENINYVNAPMIAQERGIKVIESKSSQIQDYKNLITVEVQTDKDKTVIVGTLFTHNEFRIVKIDNYILEIIPEGYLVYTSYKDVPGVVGHIGTVLGKHNINIATISCGRDKPKGTAVSILNVDSKVSDKILKEIKTPNLYRVKLIKV